MTMFYKSKPININGYRLTIINGLNLSGVTLAVLLLMGCSESAQYNDSSNEEVAYEESMQAAEDMSSAQGVMSTVGEGNTEQNETLTVENLGSDSAQRLDTQVTGIEIAGKTLVVNVNADFKVVDVIKSSRAIESLTQQQGGYVALSSITNNETDRRTFAKGDQNITLINYQRQANMTVRVPKANLNVFLQQLQAQIAFLNDQTFSAQDVTLDIYRQQLTAKINNDMAVELEQQRLNSKSGKEQNSNVDAITATYAARQQQEYAKLEQMDIADKVKFSTLNLNFSQPISSYKETTKNIDLLIESETPSFSEQVVEAMKVGWDTLKTAIIKLIGLWWFVVLLAVIYGLYRLIKMAYRKLLPVKSVQRKKLNSTNRLPVATREAEDTHQE